MESIGELTDEICGMMQLAMKDSGLDFAENNLDIECAKKAIEFAIAVNKNAGLLTGKYERILSALNALQQ
jgi:hypothetical protein